MKLTKSQKEDLRKDILDRYDNEEYWDSNMVEGFEKENKSYKIIFERPDGIRELIIVDKEVYIKLYIQAKTKIKVKI